MKSSIVLCYFLASTLRLEDGVRRGTNTLTRTWRLTVSRNVGRLDFTELCFLADIGVSHPGQGAFVGSIEVKL